MKKESVKKTQQQDLNTKVTSRSLIAIGQQFLRMHWLAVVIVIIGTWLRVVDLPQKAIVFPDAGRDLLAATSAVKNRELPLLGIPSSVPRFKQGPLSIWLNMAIFKTVGYDMSIYSIVYAFIGVLALLAIYETGIVHFNQRVGLFALGLLSFSPLAIAHSRMAYHTTPIPLFTIFYWWGLQAMVQQKKLGVFWAVLTGWLLFQFELSMFPVLLAIPIVIYFKKLQLKQLWRQIVTATGIGLLPQIIFDFTHQFTQLGGFAIWIVYRIFSLVIPSEHAIGTHKAQSLWSSISTYIPRIWGVDVGWINTLLLCMFVISIVLLFKKWHQSKHQTTGLLLLIFLLITLGYAVHGSPSEAYYPIYFVLLPLITAAGWELLGKHAHVIGVCLVLLIGGFNTQTIIRHNFFVSNVQTMSYGPGNQELLQMAKVLINTKQQHITIALGNDGMQFPSSFDNLQWAVNQLQQLQKDQKSIILQATTPDQAMVLVIPNKQKQLIAKSQGRDRSKTRFTTRTFIWQPQTNDKPSIQTTY